MHARHRLHNLSLHLNLLLSHVSHLSHHALLQEVRERELQRGVVRVDLEMIRGCLQPIKVFEKGTSAY